MNRNTIILALAAFIIVAIATPFQLFGVPLAPFAALVLGGIAGWWVSGARNNGAKAGAIVGLGALLGSVIGLAVLALFLGNIPEVQAFVQNSEPHPEARIPTEWIAPLGALAGVVVGLIVGAIDMGLSALAGWVAGLINNNRSHPMGA